MKKITATLLFLFIAVSFTSTSVNAQAIGKIFDKIEAETLFGASVNPTTISKGMLQILLKKADDNVMFMLKDNQLIIRTGEKVLYPAGYKIQPEDVFYVFSKDVVYALLNYMLGTDKIAAENADNVNFEMIGDVMVVTYGAYALEYSLACPPYCP